MPETVIIHNPQSGSGTHADTVRARADLYGYELEQTEQAGEAITLTQEAVEAGYSTIVAAGGDGTVNEVVQGIDTVDAFDAVTLGILPLGTGNNFAEQIGITDLETAFSVLEDGDRRRIDVGRATDRPFVNSCVAGLTATSSSETSAEMKSRIGVLAYVLTTLRTASEFESPHLTIESETGDGGPPVWSGEALCVMVGNGRRFTPDGSTQANMEDGLFEVAIIKNVATLDLMSDTILERLLGRDSAHIDRFKTSSMTITSNSSKPVRFSLDGEIIEQHKLVLDIRPKTLRLAVGDGYEPDPKDR